MASLNFYSNIQRLLFLYADLVEQSNSLGLSNETVDAENLFCAFLNKAFDWNLKNANELKKNQDSFDLIDNRKGLAVQVTSNKNHSAKLSKTIAAFKRNQKNKKIKRLIILFISKKCSASVLKEVKAHAFVYEAFDIPKLLSKVYYKNKLPSQLRVLNQIFEEATAPVLINSTFPFSESSIPNNGVPPQMISINKRGIYIKRKELIENIFSFSQITNGLIVGGPGVGKSFTVEELLRFCKQKKIPCFIIKINELLDATDDEIKKELNTSIYWLNALKKISWNNEASKAVLIFDAFDTAKDERLKSAVLKQIRDAIKELKNKWSILVSVRTFDAAKSSRLLELFPQINIAKSVSCRYFEIPELSETELNIALQKNKKLYAVVEKCTHELKTLLRVPYFLKLLENIINDSIHFKTKDLIHIETEEQLLEVFWNKKVSGGTDKDLFLRTFTEKLTLNENLSCSKSSVITELNHPIFDHLNSLGVIIESSVTKQNISFSHNILLEFAISKYLISDDPDSLISYITEKQKMPFHFRQSFTYFYSKLWKLEKDLYWKHYFQIRSINTPLFRLYHQTILNYILGGYYTSIKELSPIFEIKNEEERGNIIRKILEGIRFINKGRIRDRDFALLNRASECMHESFLWELGFLIDKSIKSLEQSLNKKNQILISKAAFNYLKFVLEKRKISTNKLLIEANGGHWGILNLCATFLFNKLASQKLIKKVLEVLKEPDFPIRFFYILSDNLLTLFKYDETLAILIYKTLYYHTESSDKETLMGNSVVMSLRSNRRQDFESIHYKLERDYKELLEIAPLVAIPLGLEIVNKFSIDKKHYRAIEKTFHLKVNGINAKLTPDFSFYDSAHDKEYGPMSHAENIFKLLENKFKDGKIAQAINLVKSCMKHAEASSVWRRIIKLFSEYPDQVKKEAFSLLLNVPIFVCNETVYEAGELLKILWPNLSKNQRKKLEEIILSIKSSKLVKKEPDLAERRLNRLLNCIPHDDLIYSESKEFIKINDKYDNHPIVSSPTLQPHSSSREEKMADLGVESTNEFEVTLYETIERIEPFNSKYDYNNSDKPPKHEYSPLLEIVTQLFKRVKVHSFSNPKLKFNCDYEVSRYAKLLSRHGNKINKSLRNLLQEIALYFINLEEYKDAAYQKGDIKNSHGAFSPSPRTAAVQTFIYLLYSDKSGIVAPLILPLVSDNTQIIRFKALHAFTYYWHHHRNEFWNKVEERCRFEKDGMCLHEVIRSICYDNIIEANQPEIEKAAEILINSLQEVHEEVSHELWHIYAVLLLKLIIKYDSKAASDIVYANLSIKAFVRQLLFETMSVIDPHSADNNYAINPDKYQNLIQLIKDIIADRFDAIKLKGLNSDNIRDDFETIDYSIQHLYFTVEQGKKNNKGKKITDKNKIAFFNKIKPVLSFVVDESTKIDTGFMVAHTGYYFMQLLNHLMDCDPEYILTLSSSIVKCAAASGFTYDSSTLGEIVKLTEKILADHKELLSNKEHFNSLITILDQFANSGWQEALELTWRLREVF